LPTTCVQCFIWTYLIVNNLCSNKSFTSFKDTLCPICNLQMIARYTFSSSQRTKDITLNLHILQTADTYRRTLPSHCFSDNCNYLDQQTCVCVAVLQSRPVLNHCEVIDVLSTLKKNLFYFVWNLSFAYALWGVDCVTY